MCAHGVSKYGLLWVRWLALEILGNHCRDSITNGSVTARFRFHISSQSYGDWLWMNLDDFACPKRHCADLAVAGERPKKDLSQC